MKNTFDSTIEFPPNGYIPAQSTTNPKKIIKEHYLEQKAQNGD
jgi:hypothetical protein